MTRFELAASWSQTRRSSQTEPHPDVYNIISMKLSFLVSLKNLFSLAQGKTYYIIRPTICQHFFLQFFYFFQKKIKFHETRIKSGFVAFAQSVFFYFPPYFFNSRKFFYLKRVRKKSCFTGFSSCDESPLATSAIAPQCNPVPQDFYFYNRYIIICRIYFYTYSVIYRYRISASGSSPSCNSITT